MPRRVPTPEEAEALRLKMQAAKEKALEPVVPPDPNAEVCPWCKNAKDNPGKMAFGFKCAHPCHGTYQRAGR